MNFWKSEFNSVSPCRTALSVASSKGEIEIVRLLLSAGAWVNASCDTGLRASINGRSTGRRSTGKRQETALELACMSGRIDIVEILISAGAGTQMQCNWGPLSTAAEHGHIEIVKIVLQNIIPEQQTHECSIGLRAAAQSGHIDIVILRLSNGADLQTRKRYVSRYINNPTRAELSLEEPALNAAARGGNIGIFRLFLDSGARIMDDDTTILAAVEGGNVDIVKLLLDSRETVIDVGYIYDPWLCAAAQRGHLEVVKFLLDKGATGWGAFSAPVLGGHRDTVNLLLQRGHQINAFNDGSALSSAAKRGDIQMVQLYLDGGADVNSTRERKKTALYKATKSGHIDIVKLLLQAGAEIHPKKDQWEWAPLYAAISKGHTSIGKLLIDNYADNLPFSDVLLTALQCSNLDLADILVESVANCLPNFGFNWTNLLTAATICGHLRITQLLLDQNPEYLPTPHTLHAAIDCGHLHIVKLLLAAGAKVTHPSKTTAVPLYTATQFGYTRIVQLLLNNLKDITEGTRNSALLWAAGSGCIDLFNLLDSDPANLDSSLERLLKKAIEGGNIEIVKLCVSRQGGPGNYSLYGAICSGQVNIVQLILSYPHIAPHVQRDRTSEALKKASRLGYIDLVKLLFHTGAFVNCTRPTLERQTAYRLASNGVQ